MCLIAPDFTISVYGSSCNYLSFYLFAHPRHEECQGIYMRKKRRRKRETYINCCTHNCKIFDSPLQCFLNSIAQLLSELQAHATTVATIRHRFQSNTCLNDQKYCVETPCGLQGVNIFFTRAFYDVALSLDAMLKICCGPCSVVSVHNKQKTNKK